MVPPGAWAVGVSGGADSVALLKLLADHSDLRLHVVHLNHETRGTESDGDEAFVRELAGYLGLPCTIARMSEMPPSGIANPSARFRAARFQLFRRVVQAEQLEGVILGHHADDQAETILHRLLRGSGPLGLGGIRAESRINGLRVLHPLLDITRESLRSLLTARGDAWREDASNASPRYLRNRLRGVLRNHCDVRDPLLRLGETCRAWRSWLDATAPKLPERFPVGMLRDIPSPLAYHAAAWWLRERGAQASELTTGSMARLLTMATDAASAARLHFPGGLVVRRRSGEIFGETANWKP